MKQMRDAGGVNESKASFGEHQAVASSRFGTYSLLSRLGEGGMAVVYMAEAIDQQGQLLRVALKVVKPGEHGGVDNLELFATEGDVMALLRHPNLVELYEVGKWGNHPYLAMEYLPGGDLASLIAAVAALRRPFPRSVALKIGIDLARGLSYVHQAQGVTGTSLGLVHGDVNPSNVFLSLTPERAKLGDFGVVTSSALGGGLPEGLSAG
jgi:serine/threonine protein kinase